MHRRQFLRAMAAAAVTAEVGIAAPKTKKITMTARDYLASLMPTREQVTNFVRREQGPERLSRNDGWTFDADLGWVLCDSLRHRSVDGSKGFYSYEKDGARRVVNFADIESRIHTYGNSFTHCDQVSDPETWQEYLAGHLQEPIRNYGVGGYGVYQAYLRMLKVEKENPAEYIILNIWDDDHYRNLDAWRSIRFGHRTSCGFTLPYLKVDLANGKCEQKQNVCQTEEDVYKLCNENFVWKTFKDDPVLGLTMAAGGNIAKMRELAKPVAVSFGIPAEMIEDTPSMQKIKKAHTEAALFATKNIVTWTEDFVKKAGKKLMIILSFGQGNTVAALSGGEGFDKSFTDWLKDKAYPVIDMRQAFLAEYKQSKLNSFDFSKKYYIGHHNPAGNFFTTWAIKDQLVKWLEPKPRPYL